jgi:hypothetical protein
LKKKENRDTWNGLRLSIDDDEHEQDTYRDTASQPFRSATQLRVRATRQGPVMRLRGFQLPSMNGRFENGGGA